MKKQFLLFSLLLILGSMFGMLHKTARLKSALKRMVVSKKRQIKQKKKVRVYVDMVGDLFHYGHVKMLKQAKSMGDELIVGINSDEDVASYKRVPYLTMKERIKSVKGCRYVDEVVGNVPLRVTKEFIKKHNIDLVIHGDDWPEEMLKDYYKDAMELGKFKTVPYTKGVSTSDIIRRVQARKTA